MKIVCTSDWHLDWMTSGHSRFDEVCASVDHSVKVALEEKADMYVMVGDLTNPDSPGVHRSVAKLMAVAKLLSMQGIKLLVVAGNHDVVEDGHGTTVLSSLAASELALVQETPGVVGVGECTIIALPFTPRSHAYEPAKWIRKTATKMPAKQRSGRVVVFGHLSLSGITPGSETTEMPRGREVTWPTDEIRKWFPNALLIGGHYHKAQEFDGVNIVGSLARLTHGEEENQPGILVVEV